MTVINSSPRRDQRLVTVLTDWFVQAARALPWRTAPRDPYRSLVAEAMLQQTQVSRVIPYFERFVATFPTIGTLAGADDQAVLSCWSGLGYYRRARHLHAAAKEVMKKHGGIIPNDVDRLVELPGIGRYTAGAIASIVHQRAAPIVDGNVARVLMRLEGMDLPPAAGATQIWLWNRAEALVRRASRPDLLNEGMMELGATVCTPFSPRCAECPLRALCKARRAGTVLSIPRPKAAPTRQLIHAASVVVVDTRGRRLVVQRPCSGVWADLWEAPTLETKSRPSSAILSRWACLAPLVSIGRFSHLTSHREYRFRAFHVADVKVATRTPQSLHTIFASLRERPWRWLSRRQIASLPLSNPQRRILLTMD